MDYDKILDRLKRKAEYFKSIDFPLIASEFEEAAKAIESLLEERDEMSKNA